VTIGCRTEHDVRLFDVLVCAGGYEIYPGTYLTESGPHRALGFLSQELQNSLFEEITRFVRIDVRPPVEYQPFHRSA
jgi:hypothetical protein